MDTTGCALFDTALGPMGVAWGPVGLLGLQLPDTTPARTLGQLQRRGPSWQPTQPPASVMQACRRIDGLTRGVRDDLLDLPLDFSRVGSFERRVYDWVRAISPGQTRTYGEVARALGEPGAAQAVGQALGRNPFAPVVPCHRILAAAGRAGGFSAPGGLRTKLRLLEIEGAAFGPQPGLF